jgi:hypothetical protein
MWSVYCEPKDRSVRSGAESLAAVHTLEHLTSFQPAATSLSLNILALDRDKFVYDTGYI